MIEYGIKLVSAGWNNENFVGFSDRAAKRWQAKLPSGTRMLLYETGTKSKGTKSIIAEVEVNGTFEEGEALKQPGEEHDRLILVKVIRRRESQNPISLEKAREILNDENYPRMGESWRPLSRAEYDAFIKEWA